MTTDLLYFQDDYLKTFEATVLSVDAQSVVLDSTAFYPTGGHQNCDQGLIEKNRKNYMIVTDVLKEDSGLVRHYYAALKGSIRPGDKIKGMIDWMRRFQHMQLHTSQHLFSRCALDRFKVRTGRANFSPQGGLVVTEHPLSWEQVFLLEAEVNRLIAEDRPVSRFTDEKGLTRLSISDFDRNPCGGTHVKSTSEIGLFKITHLEDRNITYQVGKRARQRAIRLANNAIEAAARFELEDPMDLTSSVEKLFLERDEVQKKLADLKQRETRRQITIAKQTVKQLAQGASVFQLDLSYMRSKKVMNLLKKQLLGENQIWLCLAERRNLVIASTVGDVHANRVLEVFTDKWDMRGGGNPWFAQGGPVPEQIAAPLEKAATWLLASG